MAFKLTKKQRADLVALQDAYQAAAEALSKALTELADDWQAEFNDRSLNWQAREPGRKVQEKIERVRETGDDRGALPLVDFDDL